MKLLFLPIIALFSFQVIAQINDEAIAGIHWGWIDNGAPDYVCASDEIAPGIQRGFRGPRTCFEQAIAASKGGNDALALRWIVTTQCHNASARNSLLSGGIESVKFLMNTYGGGYTNGPKTPNSQTAQCTISVYNNTDKDYEVFYLIFKVGQHIPCEALGYGGTIARGASWSTLFGQGNDIWVRFKTVRSDGCTSADEKFQIFGTGNFTAKKDYVIN